MKSYKLLKILLIGALVITGASCKDSTPPAAQTAQIDKVWALAKACGEDKCDIDDLDKEFAKLTNQEDLNKLAAKTDGEYNFTLYLVKGRLYKKSASVLDKFLSSIDKQAVKKQLDASLKGKKAFDMVRGVRPSTAETPDDTFETLVVLVGFEPDVVNDIKTPGNTFDVDTFNALATHLKPTKSESVVDRLNTANQDAWLLWIMSHKALGQPAFKKLYSGLDAAKKTALRTKVVANIMASAAVDADIADLISAADPWGLKSGLDTKMVYDAAANGAVGNYSVHVLYFAVIKDDAKARALSQLPGAGPGVDRFLSLLAKRAIDAPIESVSHDFMQRLNTIAPAIVEAQIADTGAAGVPAGRPLNVLVTLPRAPIPAGSVDGHELQFMVDDMLRHASGATINDLTEAQLEAIVTAQYAARATTGKNVFNSTYSKLAAIVPPTPKAQAVRSKLLSLAIAGGAVETRELVDDITGLNAWGLQSGLNTDIYVLRNAANTANFTGSLLYVLTKRAVEAVPAGSVLGAAHGPYNQLRIYAEAIKTRLETALVGSYATHIATNYGTLPTAEHIDAPLSTNLAAAYANFTNYYLAMEKPQDVLLAAANAIVPNNVLRDLYSKIIVDDAKAAALAVPPPPAVLPATDRFIHWLAKRPASPDTQAMLEDFLTKVGNNAVAVGPAAPRVADQLADMGAGAGPLNLLMAAPRAFPGFPGGTLDGPEIAAMKKTALAASGGAVIDSLSQAQLEAIVDSQYAARLTAAPNNGQDAFKAMYGKVNAANQQIMRSKLLNLAYAAGMVDLINAAVVSGNDSYGLLVGLGSDVYILRNQANTADFRGTLLFVLSKRAPEDKAAGVVTAYADLRDLAVKIKTNFVARGIDYNDYATADKTVPPVQGGETAFGVLLNALVTTQLAAAQQHGFAQYTLDLNDSTFAVSAFDESTVAAAADVGDAVVSNFVLEWLYANGIKNNVPAGLLAAKVGVIKGDTFIHRLLERPADKHTTNILRSFLKKVEANAAGAALAQVKSIATVAPNIYPLAQLITPGRVGDVADDLNEMIQTLVRWDDGTAIAAAVDSDAKAASVLTAVYDRFGTSTDLAKVFKHLDNAHMKAVAEWSAEHAADSINAGAGAMVTIASLFRTEYANRAAPEQKVLRNNLINKAYALGAAVDVQTAVNKVTELITRDFFDEATLRLNTYDAFIVGADSTLLYDVLAKAKTAGPLTQPLVNGIATALKAKFVTPTAAADWQAYLSANNNLGGANQIIEADLVRPNAGDQATARLWLAY